jgi:hypothetical protein
MLQLAYCNLWTFMTFGWCYDVMKIGYQRPLQPTDLRKVDREWSVQSTCRKADMNSQPRISAPFGQPRCIVVQEGCISKRIQCVASRRHHLSSHSISPQVGPALARETSRDGKVLENKLGQKKAPTTQSDRGAVQEILLPCGAIQSRGRRMPIDGSFLLDTVQV